jgi:diguanylate cyclase (GGDEF)-like protein
MPDKPEHKPTMPPGMETITWGKNPLDVSFDSSGAEFKMPTLIETFIGLAVVIVIALFFLGEYLPQEMHTAPFLLTSIIAISIIVGFGIYALRKVSSQSKHYQYLLNIDRTTGLYSSVFLMEELDKLVSEGKQNLVLMFLDLDELKLYNDKYGHRAGDKLIHNAAEAIMDAIAGRGVGFRYGGDEFVAVLTGVTSEDALLMAKRVQAAFANREISASIGVYPWRPGLSPDQLLHEADKAMYTAKRAGKGRIFIGSPECDGTAIILGNELID